MGKHTWEGGSGKAGQVWRSMHQFCEVVVARCITNRQENRQSNVEADLMHHSGSCEYASDIYIEVVRIREGILRVKYAVSNVEVGGHESKLGQCISFGRQSHGISHTKSSTQEGTLQVMGRAQADVNGGG